MRFRRYLVTLLAAISFAVGLASADLSAQTARCRDGSLSYSKSRSGTCSRHGGVAEWLSSADTAKRDDSKPAPKTTPAPTKQVPAVVTASDANGRINRSEAAKLLFMRQNGYPKGRPGYVVDHIVPLACGGPDAPSNMQWQTIAEAKAKDRENGSGAAESGGRWADIIGGRRGGSVQ